MSRTFNLSTLNQASIKTVMSPISFDPIEFIRDNVPTEKARAQILSSMAWYIDITLVNSLRTLYFSLFQTMQVGGDIDNYNDFIAMMNAQDARERNLVEQGFMDGEGVGTVRKLFLLRQTWHDAALINQRHTMPTIDQLLQNEKPQLPSALTKEKLRMLAEDEAEGNKELCDELLNELVQRETLQAVDRHEASRARVPAMIGMASFIQGSGVEVEADFCDLPIETRKRLLNGVASAISQALTRMTSDRTVSVLEFMAVRKELKAASAALADVLKHPHYNDQSTQSSIDEQRLDKRLASKEEAETV